MATSSQPLRVIQWATGAVGSEMLTTILDHRPDIQIVGARVYSEAKNGVDIGTLVGRAPIGVAATTDVAQILALEADLVLYAPSFTDFDDVCALLESGKNVATVSFLFHPRRIPEHDRARLAEACRKGGSTIHASGLNPGNLSGVLPLALSGMSRTIDKFTLQERADWSLWESTDITFDGMWFGRPTEHIAPNANDFLSFNRRGEPLVEFETLWTVGGQYPEHWPQPADGWTLTLEGDPSMRTHFLCLASYTRPASVGEHVRVSLIAVAMQVVNAIPAIVKAPAGFATMADLPLIRSYTGFGDGPVPVAAS